MPELVVVLVLALAGSGLVGIVGLLVLRGLHGQSVTVHIVILLATTVLAVVAGVIAVAEAMFISEHDLGVLLVVLVAAGARQSGRCSVVRPSTGPGERLGGGGARAGAAAGRQPSSARRLGVARSPHAARRAAGNGRGARGRRRRRSGDVAYYHRRMRAETDRISGLVDDLFELSGSTPVPC